MVRAAVIFFVLLAVYTLFLALAAGAKIVEFGWHKYAEHFTNWSWTAQLIFYALMLPGFAYADWGGAVAAVAFFPLLTIVMSVWLGSSMLLVRDPAFITDLFDIWPPGVVMVGNDVFHVLPVIVIILFAWWQGSLIYYGLRRLLASTLYGIGPIYFLAACVWQVWGGALTFVGLYRIFFDPNDVYETDLPEAQALGLVLAVGFFITGSALAMLIVFYGLVRPPPAQVLLSWQQRLRRGHGFVGNSNSDGDPWAAERAQVMVTRYELAKMAAASAT